MDTEDGPIGIRLRGPKSAMSPLLPEVDCYLHLLVLLHLLDVDHKDEAVECSEELMTKLSNYNRRSLDHVAGRCYYYHTLSHEAKGQMSKIRGFLHCKLRTATLNVSRLTLNFSLKISVSMRTIKIPIILNNTKIIILLTFNLQKDFEGQAVLINCLLRNYLQHNLYDQVKST